ncbi:MAG TPA: hypothetical protein VG146_11100 [Verrucomicrobiae bacterium]|nr:hypothetical protein [Verrucomicrobiae bacterium]
MRSALWASVISPELTLALGEPDSSTPAGDAAIPPNPFTKAYWKLVLCDVKETFTAPAVQRNRNGRLDNISTR